MKHMLLIDRYPLWKIFAHCGCPLSGPVHDLEGFESLCCALIDQCTGTRNVRNEEKGQKGCFLKSILFVVSLYWITRQTYCESRISLLQATAHSL